MNGHAQAQMGFTLVEIMVSMVIGLLLVAGVVALAATGSQGNRQIERQVRQIENGRFAIDVLSDHLRHAGFYGGLYPPVAPMPALPAALPDPCGAATPTFVENGMRLFLQGLDSPAGDPAGSCLTDADHVDGTDVVTIRRAGTLARTPAYAAGRSALFLQAAAGDYRLDLGTQSDPDANGFGVTQSNAAGLQVAAPLRDWQVETFYIAPRTRPVDATPCDGDQSDAGRAIPTLMRLRLAGSAWCAEPLAAGIEMLQIEYGIDTSDNGIPNQFEEQPDNPQEWADVVGLRLYLLARTQQPLGAATDPKTYRMGEGVPGPDGTDDFTPPAGDGHKRHLFTSTVRLANPAGRREKP